MDVHNLFIYFLRGKNKQIVFFSVYKSHDIYPQGIFFNVVAKQYCAMLDNAFYIFHMLANIDYILANIESISMK